jgi:hypothetical protein
MNISSSEPREPFFVPSFFCQSLLGKAIQEHFTEPEEVASVFSSSPSLQNSSAGANFMTNFIIDGDSIDLFRVVFTPEDCFSVSFSPSLYLDAGSDSRDESTWKKINNLMKTLLTHSQKYLEASLRSLTIASQFIINDELQFIFSNLKRVTKFNLDLYQNSRISYNGLKCIAEKLLDLEELRIDSCFALDDTILEQISRNLKKLVKLTAWCCHSITTKEHVQLAASERSLL